MFVILVTYKKSLDMVDKYLTDHSDFLEQGYQNNYFIVSGRRNPRTGGVILSKVQDRKQLEDIIKRDPFYIHKIADYELIEFIPTKFHTNFVSFVEETNQ